MPATVALPDLSNMPMSRTLVRSSAVVKPVRAVKRMLFPVDHEQVRRDLDAEARARCEAFSERYNFDLSTETPLPGGRYEWSYDRAATLSTPKTEDAVATDATLGGGAEEAPIGERPQPAAAPSRQGLITDFYSARKRPQAAADKSQQPPPRLRDRCNNRKWSHRKWCLSGVTGVVHCCCSSSTVP
uniref:Cyclin-dependent kinase inhibitor domain-containing protein n=1 Tax=Amblyomma maculatum TaxID=34609 RepID=G3MSG7_AMBMU